MRDILGSEFLSGRSEFEHDAVRVGEIDRSNEHTVMHFAGHAHRAVIMVDDGMSVRDACFLQAIKRRFQFLFSHVESEMVHRAHRRFGLGRKFLHRGDPGSGRWSILPPEEGDAVAIAAVEEEMLTAIRQFDCLEQRHLEHLRVELDSFFHVAAYQGDVIDPGGLDHSLLLRLPNCPVDWLRTMVLALWYSKPMRL